MIVFQCVNGQGACSDVSLGGTNDAMLVDARQTNGITVMKYRRALNTGDDNDVVYDPSAPIYIVWAMGRMQPNGLVSKHDFVLTRKFQLLKTYRPCTFSIVCNFYGFICFCREHHADEHGHVRACGR